MAIDYSPELGLATAYKLRRSNCSLSLVEHAIQLIIRTTNNQHSCLGTRISFVVTLELPSGDVNFHYRMFLFRLCLSSRFKRAERIVNFFPPYLSPFLCPQAKKKKNTVPRGVHFSLCLRYGARGNSTLVYTLRRHSYLLTISFS